MRPSDTGGVPGGAALRHVMLWNTGRPRQRDTVTG